MVNRRRKTARNVKLRGGVRPDIKDIMDNTPMTPNLTVNPNSKFVVVTYWWGGNNKNKNTQKPCIGDLQEQLKDDLMEDLNESDEDFQEMTARKRDLIAEVKRDPRNEDAAEQLKEVNREIKVYLENFFNTDKIKALINTKPNEMFAKERTLGKGHDPISFEDMIKMWENRCKEMECNYMAVQYPFQPKVVIDGKEFNQYQYAINAKPYFIKKALQACQGRAVLYIDGDMFVNKYPHLFDMENVDFMARGWNMDPRSSADFLTDICFDPYSFETSGGTMYFANSPKSHMILDEWVKEASNPIHDKKADDRVLSMLITQKNWTHRASILPLPIEYLWLTNMYEERRSVMHGYADPCDTIIEHPACLTSEDTATAGTNTNRTPVGYDEAIYNHQACDTYGGVFYEYIFFPTERMVSTFGPYLQYMRRAVHHETKQPLYKVISFADKYGEFNPIADKNFQDSSKVQVSLTSGVAKLPMASSIATIMAHLEAGVDVQLGDDTRPLTEGTDCRIKLIDEYVTKYIEKSNLRDIQIKTSAPIYFSATNSVLLHLLAMCSTIEDINKHLKASYIFASRIRWSF